MGRESLDLYFNGQETVVAYSEEDAALLWSECFDQEDYGIDPWTKLPRDGKFCLVITEDSELPAVLPDKAEVKVNEDYHYLISATCGAWAMCWGRGLLGFDE